MINVFLELITDIAKQNLCVVCVHACVCVYMCEHKEDISQFDTRNKSSHVILLSWVCVCLLHRMKMA